MCLVGCAKRAKLDRLVQNILTELSADSYKEMITHVDISNQNLEHEQNTLFSSV